MALLPTAPRIVRYTLNGFAVNPIATVLDYYVDENIPDSGRPEAVVTQAEIIRDSWQDSVLDTIGNNYTFTGISYVDLNSDTGVTGVITPNSGKATQGQISGAQLPPNNALLVTKRTASRRGTKTGRMFIPQVPEASVDDSGGVSGGFIASSQAIFDDFYDATTTSIVIATTYPVVVHWTRDEDGKIDPAIAGVPTKVDAFEVQNKIATQRRRLRR